ncbi:MAG: hypothetical protein ACXVCN_17685 [Bdellovibrio sp.]
MKTKKYPIAVLTFFIVTVFFQNCSNVRFMPENKSTASQTPVSAQNVLCANPISGQNPLPPGSTFTYYTISSGTTDECSKNQIQSTCLSSGQFSSALPQNIGTLISQGTLFTECTVNGSAMPVVAAPPVIPDSVTDCPKMTHDSAICDISFNTPGNLSADQLNIPGAVAIYTGPCAYGSIPSTIDPKFTEIHVATLRFSVAQYTGGITFQVTGSASPADNGKDGYLCVQIWDANKQTLKTFHKRWPIEYL